MVKDRAQKTSADFNTYLVNRKPQRKYKKDLWRNLGKNFFFRFFLYTSDCFYKNHRLNRGTYKLEEKSKVFIGGTLFI